MMASDNEALAPPPSDTDALTQLETAFGTSSPAKQLRLLAEISAYQTVGYSVMQRFLLDFKQRNTPPTFIEGRCYEYLWSAPDETCQQFLQQHFPTGIVPLRSARNIDYQPLQALLLAQDFQEADRLTLEKLCELAGEVAMRRKWLYFTEVEQMPIEDLQTLNQLWLVHSEGKFGFTVQRQLWLSVGQNWESFWPKIAWKTGRTWTRYPDGFIWDLDQAPRGHLPLSNQLRGVQSFNALLNHPAWT
ncbi:GUN4 domain-containing protein [Lyngbya confervoides]|uniref:GUN4 domain-containing protein n=1 Tax=Lyngbya confervoides BDU141951 TaxID=1574623 RepID=A0ABD4T2C6_9CYAN|nr:GUN4 domain-containing protein [Lyngbya confervoides]MCM1982732.1 GUN4 domain-containing protein [Lyngbya confervoides BDU141951]